MAFKLASVIETDLRRETILEVVIPEAAQRLSEASLQATRAAG